MMKKILQKNEKALRHLSKEVPIRDIQTIKIKKVLKEMSEALKSQNDGVALAAPQIGYSLRIFIVSGKIFTRDFIKNKLARDDVFSEADAGGEERLLNQNNTITETISPSNFPKNLEEKDLVFVNPKISKLSRKKEWMSEGCLSVRPLYGKTFRSNKAIITAYDENGRKFTRGASGLLAQIFQHETDHLNGILFIDHAKEIKEELPK